MLTMAEIDDRTISEICAARTRYATSKLVFALFLVTRNCSENFALGFVNENKNTLNMLMFWKFCRIAGLYFSELIQNSWSARARSQTTGRIDVNIERARELSKIRCLPSKLKRFPGEVNIHLQGTERLGNERYCTPKSQIVCACVCASANGAR